MNLLNLLCLILSAHIVAVASGIGVPHFAARLQQSPIGIGVRSALSRQPSTKVLQKCTSRVTKQCRAGENEDEEEYTRDAAVTKEEADALGFIQLPYLRTHQKSSLSCAGGDELDWLEGDASPCVKLSIRPPKGSMEVAPLEEKTKPSYSHPRGGVLRQRPLVFWENMVCGAVSRSIAQTVMHPANTMKTILQSSRGTDGPTLAQLMKPDQFRMLTRGAGANFILSVPHGAVNFAVLEFVRSRLAKAAGSVPYLRERADSFGPALDFTSSAISTICCSVVSTPQMMITDNIMAGNYPNLSAAIAGLYKNGGIIGFYRGWFAGIAGKIPSYALTWTFFQQIKRARDRISHRPAKNIENTMMGCMASAAAVCIMIPMDTIKTRLVTQMSAKVVTGVPYKGIVDCAVRVAKEEGIRTFYRGLPPRLISVVPMIGIQFGVYEAMKKVMLQRSLHPISRELELENQPDRYGAEQSFEEAAMEVAASTSQPLPAPHFLKKIVEDNKEKLGMNMRKR